MIMDIPHLVLLWLPFTFLLHNAVHECAHGSVALYVGGKIDKVWLLPSFRLGRFTWAHVVVDARMNKAQLVAFLVAPVVAELAWSVAASIGFMLTSGVVQTIMLVETVAAHVDIINWWAKLVQQHPHPETDAAQVQHLVGLSKLDGILLCAAHVAVVILTYTILYASVS